MSFLNRMLPCPCRTSWCRIIYASRCLAVAAGLALDAYIAYRFGWV